VIFGNRFFDVDTLHTVSKTAQMGHAIGIKSSYYTKSDTPMTVRFIEGPRRLEIIRKMYPKNQFALTGFAKLDPLYNHEIPLPDLTAMGLDPDRKTILYAPTFYPSSIESFPESWPQEFQRYNLIVKPHYFSMTKEKYKGQRRKFEAWAAFPNVYLAGIDEHSLLPFMVVSDLLISEASSSIFEFSALDKPIVWCDFLNLRWSYRGPFRFRFTRRMDQDILKFSDIGAHAENYRQLKIVVDEQINHPEMFQAKRRAYCDLFVGASDGMASKRVADYLSTHG
jgi:CDP-glycerol glycerophosphotransferase (TagB/SpsB family)